MKKSKELQKEIEQLQAFNKRDGVKGTMDVLKTDHKRSLVGAINELYDRPSGGGGVLIDDQVIVPDKAWSSQKINNEIQSVAFSWSTPVDANIIPVGNYNLGSSNKKFTDIWVGAVYFNDLFSQGGDIDLGNGEIVASGSVFLLDNATIDFTDASFYGDFVPLVNTFQDLGSPTKYFDVLYVSDIDVSGTVNGRDVIADGNKLDTIETGATALGLGETDTTAYRGDRGKSAYDHSQLSSGNPHNVSKADVGLSNVDNTSDTEKPISKVTQAALDTKVSWSDPVNSDIIPASSFYNLGSPSTPFSKTYTRGVYSDNSFVYVNASIFPTSGTNADLGFASSSNYWFNDLFLKGDITVNGTVDGRNVAADGAKLDGIQNNATNNSSNAYLLNRQNHTDAVARTCHYQCSSSVTDAIDEANYIDVIFDQKIYSHSDTYYDIDAVNGFLKVKKRGVYKITFTGSAENTQNITNARFTANWLLQRKLAGGTYEPLNGSLVTSYHRNSVDPLGSATTTIYKELQVNDSVRLRVVTGSSLNPQGDLILYPGGCNITLELIEEL